jgi:hypothetical protein
MKPRSKSLEAPMLRSDLLSLRTSFSRLPESFRRQIGLRYIREAIQLLGRNDVEAERLFREAKFHLPYAEAA